MRNVQICGVRIDAVTLDEAVDFALRAHEKTCSVVTPNALMLEACRHTPALADLLCRASLSLPDGSGVLMAAKRKGTPLSARVSGIDFGQALLARAEQDGLRVFLLGGADGVAVRAAEKLRERYPKLTICGSYWGYGLEGEEENDRLLTLLHASRPDILFVCLGFPLQERWIFDHLPELTDVRVVAGLGGSLDVWAGDIARAPRILQKSGMEWAWRMLRQPKRFRGLPALMRFATCRRSKL